MAGRIQKTKRKAKCKNCGGDVANGEVAYVTEINLGRKHKFVMCVKCLCELYSQLIEFRKEEKMLTKQEAKSVPVNSNDQGERLINGGQKIGTPLFQNNVKRIEDANHDEITGGPTTTKRSPFGGQNLPQQPGANSNKHFLDW